MGGLGRIRVSLLPAFIPELPQGTVENSPFFLKGDKWDGVGTSTDKKGSKLVQSGLRRRAFGNQAGKHRTCPERSVTDLGGEQTSGRKRQCAQDKG